MATRIMDEAAYKKHQAKFGRTTLRDIAGPGAKAALDRSAKRRAKFGNVKTVVDGVKHDSKREAKRYRELGLLLKAGEIDFLARQVRFMLPGGVEYVADFVYGTIAPSADMRAGLRKGKPEARHLTVEDAKGVRTPEFKIKAKLMKSEYGIDVVEV